MCFRDDVSLKIKVHTTHLQTRRAFLRSAKERNPKTPLRSSGGSAELIERLAIWFTRWVGSLSAIVLVFSWSFVLFFSLREYVWFRKVLGSVCSEAWIKLMACSQLWGALLNWIEKLSTDCYRASLEQHKKEIWATAVSAESDKTIATENLSFQRSPGTAQLKVPSLPVWIFTISPEPISTWCSRIYFTSFFVI